MYFHSSQPLCALPGRSEFLEGTPHVFSDFELVEPARGLAPEGVDEIFTESEYRRKLPPAMLLSSQGSLCVTCLDKVRFPLVVSLRAG